MERNQSDRHPIEGTAVFSQPEVMKPLPKRAHGKDALLFRREVAGRLQVLVGILEEKMLKKDIAKAIGISRSRLSNWISPEDPQKPAVEPLIELCDSTGCTLDWIFRGVKVGLETELAAKIRRVETEAAPRAADNVAPLDPPAPTRRRA